MLPDNVLDFLSANNGHILSTGSRVICDPAPTDTDEDWVVYVHCHKRFRSFLNNLGWTTDGGEDYVTDRSLFGDGEDTYDEEIDDGGFCSFKKDSLNIILVGSISSFNRWATATTLATHLNLLDKRSRIDLFSAILYGNEGYTTDKVERQFTIAARVPSIFTRLYTTTIVRRDDSSEHGTVAQDLQWVGVIP